MKKLLPVLCITLFAATLVAGEPKSFSVVVQGEGRPMILIPGLSSPGEVWDDTIAHYSDRYQTHRLTLAGFAGTKPIEGEFLPTVRRELVDYIRAKELDRPVIIGHSLGGFLAFWIASSEPDLVGPVVVVDGLPALGAVMNPDVTAEQLAQQGEAMQKLLSAQSPDQFAAQTKMALAAMITRREDLERISGAAVKSDPATVALAVKELMTTDLRPQLKNIRTPVLLIAAAGGMPDEYAKGAKARYEAQVSSVPEHEVVVATKARHFVMLDDREFFLDTVDSFLAATNVRVVRRRVEKQ